MNEENKNKDLQSNDSAAHGMLHGGNWITTRKLRRKSHHDILHRMNTKMLAIRIAVVTTLLFLLTATLSVLLYLRLVEAEEQYNAEKSDAAHKYTVIDAERADALAKLADLQASRDVLVNRLDEAVTQIEQLTKEKDDLLKENEVIANLNNTVADLQAQISEMDKQIADLTKQLTPDSEVNLQAMLEALEGLQALLETGAPMHTVSVKKYDEYGVVYYEDELVYPNLSVYVYSPKTGFSYEWDTGNTYETGELKHLIFALALIECATEELKSLPAEALAEGLVYDLADEYTLKSEDIVTGSGILKNAAPGTKYTYLELIQIMLSYCDVTAYSRLIARFGNEPIDLLLPKIEGLSTTQSIDRMTAGDMMLILRRVYALTESDSPYAADLKTALTSAVSTNYSQCLPGIDIARQYTLTGTAYHEVGIRLDGSDYMVVFMTDMPKAGAEENAYLQAVYRKLISIFQQIT